MKPRTTSKAAESFSLGQPPAEAAFCAASALSFSAVGRKAAALSFVLLAPVIVGLAACGDPPVPPTGWAIKADATQMTCLNQSSGAPWAIALDPVHHLADGQTADFGPRHIHWTATGATSDLDRATGVLTVGRGSSTGGWVSTFNCHA